MSYTALYRKFRPNHFEDVKGQDHIVTTLKNQIKSERIGHAYLFCGTRGTGKTTVAKIFAKAINCRNAAEGIQGEGIIPCGACSSCQTISAGASMNVIEIDAASNNGVENIRQIVDEVSYSPADGKYKVYIIDEVHMLSIGAFNALLKTLEEPPSYAVFILATTEVHKIPITILSRCQRYDFKRITIDTIAERLLELTLAEQVGAEEKALRYIAKAADGSMRDALSLLDQCIAFHFGEKLTYDCVLDVLGAVDTQVFGCLLKHVQQKDVLQAIELLEEMVMQGRELTQFVSDFTWYLRNLLLVKSSDHIEDVIDASTENMLRLKEEALMLDVDSIMRYIRIFSELSGQMKYAAQKRVLIEMSIIKLCRPAMENNLDSLVQRISDLEEKLEHGMIFTPREELDEDTGLMGNPPATPMGVQTKEQKQLPKAIPEEVKQVVERWQSITGSAQQPMKTYLRGAKLSLGTENQLVLVLEDGLAADFFQKEPDNKARLATLLSDTIGSEIELIIKTLDSGSRFEDNYADLSRIIHMDIDVEE